MSRIQALKQFERVLFSLSNEEVRSVLPALLQGDCIYLLGANSFIGRALAVPIAQCLLDKNKQVVLVDDSMQQSPIAGCSLINTHALAGIRGRRGVAVNLANAPFAHGFFDMLGARVGMATFDAVPVLDALDLPVIYETASAMRRATLARLDDYLSLAGKLDDAFSIQTLAACLKMRITLERSAVLPVLCSLEDEYFSPLPAGKNVTFALGENEILCDVGACVGATIGKFLAATHWGYKAIYAFEPDGINYAAMGKGFFAYLHDFHSRNIALSDAKGTLRFAETGTMGSRLHETGGVEVPVSTLDDEVPHATFLKMDVEGHETKILQGARRLIGQSRPRMAITGYHYADDLINIAQLVHEIEPRYRLRLRHHSFWYYDTILYADIPQ